MAAAVPHRVSEAMIVIETNNARLFNGQIQVKRIAQSIFDDDFQSCIDKSNDDIDDDLKTWPNLTIGKPD